MFPDFGPVSLWDQSGSVTLLARLVTEQCSLLDWAEWHYRNDEYDLELPEQPTDIDSATTDSWLAFLDCLAVKYGKPRPACLQLLRKHGAIGWRERQSASGE